MWEPDECAVYCGFIRKNYIFMCKVIPSYYENIGLGKNIKIMKTRDLIFCSIFTALIAVGAFLKITIPPFPVMFSFQTFFVFLSAFLLGTKRSVTAVVVYIILGLIGIPVFASGGGVGYIFQPTFGYILGFIPGAYLCASLCKKNESTFWKILSSFSGLCVVYLLGTLYFWIIKGVYMGDEISLWYIILNGALVFLPFDFICICLLSYITKRLKKALAGVI